MPTTRCFSSGALRTLAAGFVLASFALARSAAADEPYRTPPADVVAMIDAPSPPVVVPSPTGHAMLLLGAETYPPVALLARPFARLAGIRIDPVLGAKRRESRVLGLSLQKLESDAAAQPLSLPEDASIGSVTWSFDGKRFAFTLDLADGVEVWMGDTKSLEVHPVAGVRVNDVIGAPLRWLRDNRSLLVSTVPAGRGAAPAHRAVVTGPHVQETAGKMSRMATYRDLLTSDEDADLFEHYATSQFVVVDAGTGEVRPLGSPGLLVRAVPSANGAYFLVERLEQPFSFRVPYTAFPRVHEIWSASGDVLGTLARLPVADEVPQQGVPTGVRRPDWQPLRPATLVWAEALDNGDPKVEVPHRDRVLALDVATALAAGGTEPLASQGRELLRLEERFTELAWTGRRDLALVEEYDRDRRWSTTWLVNFTIAGGAQKKVFDRNVNDAYKDAGNAVLQVRPNGEVTLRQDGDFIYLAGRGATPDGDRPFLDRMNLRSLDKTRLFRSQQGTVEKFLGFVSNTRILTTFESRTEPPNQYLVDLLGGRRTKLTDYRDPSPALSGVEKRLLKYRRADGTPLTAFLYLPVGYTEGTRLPTILWAYPREYSDSGTAGQVRGSEDSFVRLVGPSRLVYLTQGYAVLDDPTMPVLGDPETMNDTYVEQIVGAAKAAVDTLVAMGVADPERVGIAGHSYGAFMTANLLAHSDLFAAGIARSGAYNRSLTPFGFQTERRSYWEATELYTRVSPFAFAHKINEPILLIHGEEDTNSGTYPIQTERMFQALQGNGATARLVMLPYEGHGYRARESVLHTLAEMLDWADTWVKNRPAVVQGRR